MYYKPDSSSSLGHTSKADTTAGDDVNDSGLDSMDFQLHDNHPDSACAASSLTLSSITETVEEDSESHAPADPVDAINRRLYSMTLGHSRGVDNRPERKQSQSSIENDSGNFDEFDSNNSLPEVKQTSSSLSSPTVTLPTSFEDQKNSLQIREWISNVIKSCYESTTGEVCMEQIVRLFQGNEDGDNLLNLFIIHELQDAALVLIDLCPDHDWLNLYNNLRQTPLYLAVLSQQPDVVRRLVCAGASVTEQDLLGNTPLHIACANGSEDIVRHLLSPVRHSEVIRNCYRTPYQPLPQDSAIRNFDGNTILHLAAQAGHMNIVRMLLAEHACDPNVGDGKSGRTVLHHLAEASHVEMTSLLLSFPETQCDVRDFGRYRPIDLAHGHGRWEVVRVLMSHGAKPSSGMMDSDSDDDECADCTTHNGHWSE